MNKNLLLSLLFFCFSSIIIQAQIIGDNAFLQSSFLEVGINKGGVYVTDEEAPETYHTQWLSMTTWEIDSSTIDTITEEYTYDWWSYYDSCECWIIDSTTTESYTYITYEYIYYYDTLPSPLGMIYDADMDGWDTGDPTEFWGDVSLPGSPEEGFGIEVNGNSYYNSSQYLYPFDIPGSLTSWDDSGDTTRAVWEGNIDSSTSLNVKQETLIPDNKLYFYTRITLTNTSAATMNNIYYLRNVDPDQEQPWSYDFMTKNEVIYNNPTDSQCLVSAEGNTIGGNYAMMGTRDERGKVSYGAFFTSDANPVSDAWNSVLPFYESGEMTADIAIQVSFKTDSLAPGESATYMFAYIFSNDADVIEEALAGTLKTVEPEIECIAATDLTVDEITESSALVSWLGTSSGLEYQLEWRKVGTPEWNSEITTENSLNLSSLESCTYYDYRITTLCGDALPSDAASFKTACAESVEEHSILSAVYPNPAKDMFTISLESSSTADGEIIIRDLLGNIMFEKTVSINGSYVETISMQTAAAGVYTIELTVDGNTSTQKLVLTH